MPVINPGQTFGTHTVNASRPSGLYVLALQADAVPHFLRGCDSAHFDHALDGRDSHHAAVCGSLAGELARGELLEQGESESS